MSFRLIHRLGAIILIAFITSHLCVHLFALIGPEAHSRALSAVQWIYRNPIGEPFLFFVIALQVFSGMRQMRFRHQNRWAIAQSISGAYLLFFLVIHSGAALFTRYVYGLETNFYWAAGTLYFDPIKWGFFPYYGAAIIAFFTHLATALHFALPRAPRWVVWIMPIIGVAVAVLMLSTFGGFWYEIVLPESTQQYFVDMFWVSDD